MGAVYWDLVLAAVCGFVAGGAGVATSEMFKDGRYVLSAIAGVCTLAVLPLVPLFVIKAVFHAIPVLT